MRVQYSFAHSNGVRNSIQRDINAMTFLNLITQRLLATKGNNVLDVQGWDIQLTTDPYAKGCVLHLSYQHDPDDDNTAIDWVFEKKYDSFLLDDSFDLSFLAWNPKISGLAVPCQKTFQYISSDFVYYIAKHTKAYFADMGWD